MAKDMMAKDTGRKAALAELTEEQIEQVAGGQGQDQVPGFGKFTAFTTGNTPITGPPPAQPHSGVEPGLGQTTAGKEPLPI